MADKKFYNECTNEQLLWFLEQELEAMRHPFQGEKWFAVQASKNAAVISSILKERFEEAEMLPEPPKKIVLVIK